MSLILDWKTLTQQSEAKVLFEHYRVGRALQMLESVVKDGQNYAAGSSEVRADAWR